MKRIGVKDGDLVLMVGTTKGAFLFRTAKGRRRWERSGPHFPGQPIYALHFDGGNGRRRIWAGAEHPHFGSVLHSSDDFGGSWTDPKEAPIRFPEGEEWSLKRIWQIAGGRPDEPDTLYCGVEPAALFESKDAGESWSLVRGLYDHPHRKKWMPGGGGLCLHTILPDPKRPGRMFVAISAGGLYRTDDGGKTWTPRNRGIKAPFLPDPDAEFGQCVHKVTLDPKRPDRLFLQHHWGVYRSQDAGESWTSIGKSLPSDFGFPVVTHPKKSGRLYVLPLESDMFRCVPEAKLRVYRSDNAGKTWKPLSRGLPQKGAYETILRDGFAADTLDPAGLYFGTRSGKLYASANEGNSWKLLADGLPPVVCIKTAIL